MGDLERIFYDTPHRICQKWAHYFRIYERFFSRYRRSRDLRMMEIGISQGGSLDMWRAYFGPEALIVGVDIDPRCRGYENGRTRVRIGSQEDSVFLQELVREFKEFDVVLDDGGHTMSQQIASFEALYPIVRLGGVYMVEDCHTSYHAQFGGALGQSGTFIEFAKRKIDELNGFHVHTTPNSRCALLVPPPAYPSLTALLCSKKAASSDRQWFRQARVADRPIFTILLRLHAGTQPLAPRKPCCRAMIRDSSETSRRPCNKRLRRRSPAAGCPRGAP